MKIDSTKFIGEKNNYPFEHRIVNMVLLLGIVASMLSSLLHYLLQMNPLLISISVASTVILVVLYYLSLIKRQYTVTVVLLIVSLSFVMIPLMWLFNNGILGMTPYLVILNFSMIAVLLRGGARQVALACFGVLVLCLILRDYPNIHQFTDMHIGLLLAVLILVSFFVLILNYYLMENRRADDYLLELEQHKMEVKMARLDRLNIIGEMAASIGHEVRNPLTTVRGFMQLFQGKTAFAQHKEHLDLMIEELDRANSILTEFLSLAKNKKLEFKPCDMNEIITNLLPLIRADALREGKEVVLELSPHAPVVADLNEMRQMILNLTRNGLDAMEKGGVITLSTALDGDAVVLAVKDTGTGIPPEIYEKLSTPFVTTKEKGTGLGLAVCYRIAERHNAKIIVTTGTGGTTFQIRFGPTVPEFADRPSPDAV
ncbi:MAG: ATP-binding protein [Negativicutes bacterium]|nr:ATP-binding protein [Negativicutes bacterium]